MTETYFVWLHPCSVLRANPVAAVTAVTKCHTQNEAILRIDVLVKLPTMSKWLIQVTESMTINSSVTQKHEAIPWTQIPCRQLQCPRDSCLRWLQPALSYNFNSTQLMSRYFLAPPPHIKWHQHLYLASTPSAQYHSVFLL